MKSRTLVLDILGLLMLLSILYNSKGGLTPLVAVVPIGLTSLAQRLENHGLKIVGVVILTLYIPYVISIGTMDQVMPIIYFVITMIIPLMLYWRFVLSPIMDPDPWAMVISSVYFVSVLVLFYSFVVFFEVDEYILEFTNTGPQSLILIASSVLVFLPLYIVTEFRYS